MFSTLDEQLYQICRTLDEFSNLSPPVHWFSPPFDLVQVQQTKVKRRFKELVWNNCCNIERIEIWEKKEVFKSLR